MTYSPHVSVLVDISECAYDVRINDVPVLSDVHGYPVRVEIPINHWLRSGLNTLTIDLREHWGTGEPCRPVCDVVVRARDAAARGRGDAIFSLGHVGDLKTPQVIDIGGRVAHNGLGAVELGPELAVVGARRLSLRRDFVLTLPFPEWSWFTGEVDLDPTSVQAGLFPIYAEIWHALAERRPHDAARRFYERTGELATAFYRTRAEMERVLSLAAAVADNELELYPLAEDIEVEIVGGGRLARLVDGAGEPLIGFFYKDETASQYYEFYMCKHDGRWRISR